MKHNFYWEVWLVVHQKVMLLKQNCYDVGKSLSREGPQFPVPLESRLGYVTKSA